MPKWPIKKGRESEHHFWGFPQVILSWSQSVPNTYIYLKYHRFCPLVGIGDPPTPSPASEWVLPSGTKGGGGGLHTRLRMKVWRSPNSDGWRESLLLRLHCVYRYLVKQKVRSLLHFFVGEKPNKYTKREMRWMVEYLLRYIRVV